MSDALDTATSSLRSRAPSARVFRLAALGWLIGWYTKVDNNLMLAAKAKHMIMVHPDFTGWESSHVSLLLLLAMPAASLPLLWLGHRRHLVLVALLYMACSMLGLVLLLTFNDATFTTSLWASAWLLWLGSQSGGPPEQEAALASRAPRFALMVVSLMFLGGFVGKMTPEFWSGEMFYHYFFLDRDILHYPWLRANLAPQTLREVATWFSRAVVVMEGILMVAFLAPFRKIAPLVVVCMMGVVLGSTPWLLSVFGSMFGIVLANYAWGRARGVSS